MEHFTKILKRETYHRLAAVMGMVGLEHHCTMPSLTPVTGKPEVRQQGYVAEYFSKTKNKNPHFFIYCIIRNVSYAAST